MPAKKGKNLKDRSRSHTNILSDIEIESDSAAAHSYCPLPPYFFDHFRARDPARGRTLLSVSTWDGRSVFELGVKGPE